MAGNAIYPYCHWTGFAKPKDDGDFKNDSRKRLYTKFLWLGIILQSWMGRTISFINFLFLGAWFPNLKRKGTTNYQEVKHLNRCPEMYLCSSWVMISLYLRELRAPSFPTPALSSSGRRPSSHNVGCQVFKYRLFSFPWVQ